MPRPPAVDRRWVAVAVAGAIATILVVVAIAPLFANTLVDTGEAAGTPRPGQKGTLAFSYHAEGVQAPTGRKTEASKAWFNDGSWWAVLFRPERDAYTISRYDVERDAWEDTGVVVDDRNGSQADMLWTGERLYGVSGGTDVKSEGDGPVVVRLSYDTGSGTYAMDPGFPVDVGDRGSEMFTLDRDETGRLWVTWTADRKVWASHSMQDDASWTDPFVLPVSEAVGIAPDDISSVLAYDGHIGIMWSDQADGAMQWASTAAGADARGPWSVTAVVKGVAMADDHMNLKAIRDDPVGLVLAAVKTSRNDLPSPDERDPLILLLLLRHDGTWAQSVVSTVKQNETRPLAVLDADHRQVHVMTTAPCCAGGTIYARTTSLDAIEFDAGEREPVLRRGENSSLNNPTTAKHAVTAQTGLLVLAADDRVQRYMHAYLALPGPSVPKPAPATDGGSGGAGLGGDIGPQSEVAFDGFETAALDEWTVATGSAGSVAVVERGAARSDQLGVTLAADSSDRSFAYARRHVPPGGDALTVDLEFRVLEAGLPDGNVPIIRLLAADGTRIVSVYRQNDDAGRLWIRSSASRVATLGSVDLGTWGHLGVTIRPSGGGSTALVTLDGNLIGEAPLREGENDVALLQIGNETSAQPFRLSIDDVRVLR